MLLWTLEHTNHDYFCFYMDVSQMTLCGGTVVVVVVVGGGGGGEAPIQQRTRD